MLFYKKATKPDTYTKHITANLLQEVYDKLPSQAKADIQIIMQEVDPDFSGFYWNKALDGFTNGTFIIRLKTVTKGDYSEDTMTVDIIGDVEDVYGD